MCVFLNIEAKCLFFFSETLEREMERVEKAAIELSDRDGGDAACMPALQPQGVQQAIKAVCALLGNVETLNITQALDGFNRACSQFLQKPQVNDTVFNSVLMLSNCIIF